MTRDLRSGPTMTRSIASSQSVISMTFLFWRAASSAASLSKFSRSAPEKPGVRLASVSSEISLESGLLRACTARIAARPLTSARSTTICRSKRPGTQQRRIEHVGAVGRGDQDDAGVRIEAVHLDQQLVERLLALVVTAAQAGAALAADRVDLVDEDDARAPTSSPDRRGRGRATRRRRRTSRRNPNRRSRRTARPPRRRSRAPAASCPSPAAPAARTPLGMRAPSAWNFFGYLRNSTTSASSSFASSMPATSANVTLGRFSESSLARERPNESAWLPPLWAWRKMKISNSAIEHEGQRTGRLSPRAAAGSGFSTMMPTLCLRSSGIRSRSSIVVVVNFVSGLPPMPRLQLAG